VCTTNTVNKKVWECVNEQYCKKGRCHLHLERTCDQCCFDPCSCKTYHKRGHWTITKCQEADQMCLRE
jgi:hypothetical protein